MISPGRPFLLAAAVALAAPACGGDDDAPATTDDTESGTTADGTDATSSSTTDGTTTGTDTADASTGEGSTGEPELTRIDIIVAALNEAMYTCPDLVWPDTTAAYRSSQVMLVSEAEGVAYLWNDLSTPSGDGPVVTELAYADLDPEWQSTFNVGAYGGAPTLGISLDETQLLNEAAEKAGEPLWMDFAITLTFHEGFHFLSGQQAWPINGGSRSLPYPEPWEPRYLRAQEAYALQALIDAGLGSDVPALGPAAFWRERAHNEFAAEMAAIESYDVTEGTAQYAEAMMSAVAELGCDADDAALVEAVAQNLGDFLYIEGYSGGREPYDLGVLAGVILRQQEDPNWETFAEAGRPAHEHLLSSVTPVDQDDDTAIQTAAQSIVDERNTATGMQVDPMLANFEDASYTRIPMPLNWVAGSFGIGGFYYLADDPDEPEVWLTYSATHLTPDGTQVVLTDHTGFFGIANPCANGAGSLIAIIPTADLSDSGGAYSSSFAPVDFTDLPATETTDADGRAWLCPTGVAAARQGPILGIERQPGHPWRITDVSGR